LSAVNDYARRIGSRWPLEKNLREKTQESGKNVNEREVQKNRRRKQMVFFTGAVVRMGRATIAPMSCMGKKIQKYTGKKRLDSGVG